MSVDFSNTQFPSYSTDPTTYLNALKNQGTQPGGDEQAMLQDIIQELSQILQQLQNGGQGGGAPSGGMTPPTGMTPPPGGATPPTGMTPPAGGATPPGGATSPAGGSGMTAQNASGVLASYMGSNNIGSLDPDSMYKLAQNTSGNTPPAVQQAAQFMMANPSVYQQIETHDVGGADGKSGAGNFQWAAQGGLGAQGNATPGSTGGVTPPPCGMTPPMGMTPRTGGTTPPMGMTPPTGGTTPPAGGSGMTAQNASGVLASYMGSNNVGSLDPDSMYKLAQNTSGNTPPAVQQGRAVHDGQPERLSADRDARRGRRRRQVGRGQLPVGRARRPRCARQCHARLDGWPDTPAGWHGAADGYDAARGWHDAADGHDAAGRWHDAADGRLGDDGAERVRRARLIHGLEQHWLARS
ncbi:MAG: hypothetical protein WDN30_04605 [Pararobbsia sp.]